MPFQEARSILSQQIGRQSNPRLAATSFNHRPLFIVPPRPPPSPPSYSTRLLPYNGVAAQNPRSSNLWRRHDQKCHPHIISPCPPPTTPPPVCTLPPRQKVQEECFGSLRNRPSVNVCTLSTCIPGQCFNLLDTISSQPLPIQTSSLRPGLVDQGRPSDCPSAHGEKVATEPVLPKVPLLQLPKPRLSTLIRRSL